MISTFEMEIHDFQFWTVRTAFFNKWFLIYTQQWKTRIHRVLLQNHPEKIFPWSWNRLTNQSGGKNPSNNRQFWIKIRIFQLFLLRFQKMLWTEGTTVSHHPAGETHPRAVSSKCYKESKIQHHNLLAARFIPAVQILLEFILLIDGA